MNEQEIHCGYCGDRVDPADRNIVYAVHQGEATIIQATGLNGRGRFFHRTCLPFAREYSEREPSSGRRSSAS